MAEHLPGMRETVGPRHSTTNLEMELYLGFSYPHFKIKVHKSELQLKSQSWQTLQMHPVFITKAHQM